MAEAVLELTRPGIVPILQKELERLMAEVDAQPVMASLLDGSATRDTYVAFLLQTRHYVAKTFPTLNIASRRLRALGKHTFLADLYAKKAKEEVGHEVLVDDDLRALGLDPKALLAAGPSRWTTTYIKWIDAMSNGQTATGFLGSAYLLEGLAAFRAGKIAAALRKANRIEGIGEALRFLEVHAEADVVHVEDMDHILTQLDDPNEISAIAMTAAATRVAYVGLLDEIGDLPLAA